GQHHGIGQLQDGCPLGQPCALLEPGNGTRVDAGALGKIRLGQAASLSQRLQEHGKRTAFTSGLWGCWNLAGHRRLLFDMALAEYLIEIGRDTSELQSRENLVCRLLLEKKNRV